MLQNDREADDMQVFMSWPQNGVQVFLRRHLSGTHKIILKQGEANKDIDVKRELQTKLDQKFRSVTCEDPKSIQAKVIR